MLGPVRWQWLSWFCWLLSLVVLVTVMVVVLLVAVTFHPPASQSRQAVCEPAGWGDMGICSLRAVHEN